MKIAVLKERRPNETRVAASPETVGKMVAMGLDVVVESGAGEGSSFSDEAFTKAGASIGQNAKATAAGADLVIKVQRPMIECGELADFAQHRSQCGQLPLEGFGIDVLGSTHGRLVERVRHTGAINIARHGWSGPSNAGSSS